MLVEESARAGFCALSTAISCHSEIAAPYILHIGTEEQKQYWLPKMVTGEVVGAIGMTEPGAVQTYSQCVPVPFCKMTIIC